MQEKAIPLYKKKRTWAAICAVVLSVIGAEYLPAEVINGLLNMLVFIN